MQTRTCTVPYSMSTKGAIVVPTTKAKVQLVAVLKNNDRPQKMLLSVEAQRISRILENCISQIEIVATLPALLHLNSASRVVDEEIIREIKKHQLLYERLRKTLEDLKQESEGEDDEGRRRWRAKAQLEVDIKNSVRDLLRLFRSHPDAIFHLRAEEGMEVGESECKLIKGLKRFHSHIVDKLLTSLDEESQLVLHKSASSSPAYDLKNLASLEEEVATAKKQIDAKIAQKNIEIKNVQEVSFTSLLTDKKSQPQFNISMRQASMQQEIDQLKIRLSNLILENKQAERILQEENEKVETEIEYLLQKFDSEVEEIQADLELNEIDHEREEDELRMLEKPFSVLEEECNQIQEKRRQAEEQRQLEMEELQLKTKAAILAQAWWRGYSTRKALKNKGKNKKAKKGKGKKK
ncbi:dynein regulatory complex protein 10 isoform X1 [Solea solea]|uniref:dynein regulatory complex protein 10 isoform X1 n=2 Tax=Solea solea TaxID=90069 RepID=UPI00272BF427|nr:dynein regulatory complex protein 10 isoform X1 [Solea solea]